MPRTLCLASLLAAAILFGAEIKSVPPSKEFSAQLKDYIKLKEKALAGFAEPVKKDDSQLIESRKVMAANAIREARPSAREGDLFVSETATEIRRIIRSEVKGTAGTSARKMTREGNPVAEGTPFVPKVNLQYPKEAPLSTVPPTLLVRLPQLPKGVEYRFVGKTLILYDADTRLILDLLPNALP